MYANEADVISQMEAWGLDLDPKGLTVGQLTRTKLKGRKGRKGWYHLHEFTIDDRETGRKVTLLTGAYGHFDGAESYYTKVELDKTKIPKISPDQAAENRRKQAESEKRAKNELATKQKNAALQAQRVWHRCNRTGHADYLEKKLIRGHDVRYTDSNAVVIPIQDETGYIWGLQFLLDKTSHKDKIAKRGGNNKEFWPLGIAIKGHFYQIGPMITTVCLVCEGYATGASLYEATGLPVVVCFNAGNLEPVIRTLSEYYKDAKFIICADDDDLYACRSCEEKIQISRTDDGTCHKCGQPHQRENAGVKAAMKACFDTRVRSISPKFIDQDERYNLYVKNQGKLTDYNDLHVLSSLSVVRRQVESALREIRWVTDVAARVTQTGGGGNAEVDNNLKIATTTEAVERIWFIYGTSLVFDEHYKMIYPLKAFYDGCASREIPQQWRESTFRKRVMLENIGFDPAGKSDKVICNLWDYWPTTPKEGNCDLILDLIAYLCSGEKNALELAAWLIKWIAYPIQNPGAKMQTAVIIYGPQGTGKNILGDAIKGIYGKYGATINQRALETQFNEFLSKKLFIVANEIASSSEKYEMKNALKTFITDTEIWINPKGVAAYFEENHVNILFFSNERMPVVLEQDDRRHCVMWTPQPKPDDYYIKVTNQIKNGGIEAFHHYLLSINLGDFNEHSKPPMTVAKQELIDLSKAPVLRFYDDWSSGDLEGLLFVPVMREDLYALFKFWCTKTGCRPSTMVATMDRLSKIPGTVRETEWVRIKIGTYLTENGYSEDVIKRCQKVFYHFPGCQQPPISSVKEDFYTKITTDFKSAVTKFKGGAYD